MRTRISHQLIVAVALTAAVIFGLLSHLLITSHRRSIVTIMEGYADESAETTEGSETELAAKSESSERRPRAKRAESEDGEDSAETSGEQKQADSDGDAPEGRKRKRRRRRPAPTVALRDCQRPAVVSHRVV